MIFTCKYCGVKEETTSTSKAKKVCFPCKMEMKRQAANRSNKRKQNART